MRLQKLSQAAALVMLVLMLVLLAGCGALRPAPGGNLTLRSAHDPRQTLDARFDTGLYRFDSPNHVTLVLVRGPIDEPEQAMTIDVFWEPRVGRTPLAREATNAMVRYIRFEPAADGQRHVAVYTGAGFFWPSPRPGSTTLRGHMRQATLRLIDASPGYHDPVQESGLTGRLRVHRDDGGAQRILRQLETAVGEALSYPRFVEWRP